MKEESKNEKFRRLAKQRGERALKELHLLGNLGNRNNYEYSDAEVRKLFTALEDELRLSKSKFINKKRREINL